MTAGPADSAFYEHRLLADELEIPLVHPGELRVADDGVWIDGAEPTRVEVLYRRIDEDELFGAKGADGRPLGPGLLEAIGNGTLVLANAPGNGVADDKCLYAYVPKLIEYYLGERPLLDNVPTYLCRDAESRSQVLDRLAELVTKPVDGYGGEGVVIGPGCDAGGTAGGPRPHPRRPGPLDRPGDRVPVDASDARRRAPGAAGSRPPGFRVPWRPAHGRPNRADPGGARRQQDRQFVARRRGEGHVADVLTSRERIRMSRQTRSLREPPMCGLSGELRFDGEPADVAAVARMTAAMEPRGPDGSGIWAQGPVALGHRRLKIIDLSARASQPMVDAELGLTGVFNGCLYNYKDLRETLRGDGYHFFSTSDTEVLVKAYHRWGQRCVDHFKGMFAFAVAERDTGRVILGRDRLGIKPLYTTRDAARLRFASTLPALLAGGGVDTDIDRTALHHYMTFHSVVPPPLTILTGVDKLPPATVRTFEPDGSAFDDYVYWRPDFTRGQQLTTGRVDGGGAGRPADRGGPADGGRRAGRRAAVRRARLELHRGATGRGGAVGPADLQHRLRRGRR